MPQVGLDDDIVDYLKSQVADFGETPSTVLRRLLRLPPLVQPGTSPRSPAPPVSPPPVPAGTARAHVTVTPFELSQADTAIDRLMLILSKLYLFYRDRFDRVTRVQGRTRLYFSRSRQELEEAGTSVAPRMIPGTPYFIVTNLSDERKREILEQALSEFGYPLPKRLEIVALLNTANTPHHEIDLGSPTPPKQLGPETGLQI